MGAWIEITFKSSESILSEVAPLMGAWIEIVFGGIALHNMFSRAPHGRVD